MLSNIYPRRLGNSSLLLECGKWARDWLVNAAFPLWLDQGVDRESGAFFDALSLTTGKNVAPFKRLRVLARQIYAFERAAHFGVAGASEAVAHGIDFLLGPARLTSGGGFARTFTLDGRVLSSDLDLYDQAFALFALASAYRLFPEPILRDEAQKLLTYLMTKLRHPMGGLMEGHPPTLPRRQNPHMHLLEACLSWLPDGGSYFADVADYMVSLFHQRFFKNEWGVILEYFEDDWAPYSGAPMVAEPGHHFEWAWLLSRHAALRGGVDGMTNALARFVFDYGSDVQTGFLYGEVHPSGQVVTKSCRLWPHTEWLRAELCCIGDRNGRGPEFVFDRVRRFLETRIRGLWYERWDDNTKCFADEPSPASSLYHIVGAFDELAKCCDSADVGVYG